MKYSFKIKLLNLPANRCRTFDSKEVALEHAQELAKESERVPARLVISRSDHVTVITLSCPLHGIVGYLQDFSIPLDDAIPEPPHRRRSRTRNTVRY